MNQLEARALFERLVALPDPEVDLIQAALAIAAEEDPRLDAPAWVRRIDGLAQPGRATLAPDATEADRLDRLHSLFFDELGFSGRGCDFEDPASSFLHTVVERQTGLPIALAVLYVHIGRRLGLACEGVGFPNHFLAKVCLSTGEVYVDPFRRRRALTMEELKRRLAATSGGKQKLERWMLAAATPKQILARMLRNLKNLYAKKRDLARAFSAVDRALLCQPDAWEDLRDRGLLCLALGGPQAAKRDLSRYLEQVPNASDVANIREQLKGIGSSRMFLN